VNRHHEWLPTPEGEEQPRLEGGRLDVCDLGPPTPGLPSGADGGALPGRHALGKLDDLDSSSAGMLARPCELLLSVSDFA